MNGTCPLYLVLEKSLEYPVVDQESLNQTLGSAAHVGIFDKYLPGVVVRQKIVAHARKYCKNRI